MIQATARVVHNVVEIRAGDERWTCRPVAASAHPIARELEKLFSTVYETFRESAPEEVHSTVSYQAKTDEILIQVGAEKWRTRSSVLGPVTFEYAGRGYAIHEKLTGRFAILNGTAPVATGELGFRSCAVRDYPPDLELFLTDLTLGYLIRSLFWSMLR